MTLPMSDYDRALIVAIDALTADAGPVDADAVERDLADSLRSFGAAAIDSRVPEGVMFDANRERRQITFRHLFQRFMVDLLTGMEPGMKFDVSGVAYHCELVRDRLSPTRTLGLVRGNNVLIGSARPIAQPVRLRWGIPTDAFALIAQGYEVRAQRDRAIQAAAPAGRAGPDGVA